MRPWCVRFLPVFLQLTWPGRNAHGLVNRSMPSLEWCAGTFSIQSPSAPRESPRGESGLARPHSDTLCRQTQTTPYASPWVALSMCLERDGSRHAVLRHADLSFGSLQQSSRIVTAAAAFILNAATLRAQATPGRSVNPIWGSAVF